MLGKLSALLSLIMIFGCLSQASDDSGKTDDQLLKRAQEIVQSSIVLDGHIDVPYRLYREMEDISGATEKGDFDYPRAKEGGLDVPFMSIYIPARYQRTSGASKKHAEYLITMMDSIIAANPEKFAAGRSVGQVRENFEKGLISFAYGMENGSGIEDDLSNLKNFYDKGIRYITLTHSKKNLICDSSYDTDKGWDGLSEFGRDVVDEMNRLGIMIDISHVSDSTFYQVLRLSKAPVICSHSSLRHFTPGWERNVDDDMLRALAGNGGVVQINYGSSFLTAEANVYNDRKWAHVDKFMAKNKITERSDPRVQQELDRYEEEHPFPYADIEDVIDHIDRAVEIAGIDHVGLGSDFDGVGDSLPTGLKSVADIPNIVVHLLKRGYSDQDIRKILGENVLRVWQAVEAFATN